MQAGAGVIGKEHWQCTMGKSGPLGANVCSVIHKGVHIGDVFINKQSTLVHSIGTLHASAMCYDYGKRRFQEALFAMMKHQAWRVENALAQVKAKRGVAY